jgi:hypothetical protein
MLGVVCHEIADNRSGEGATPAACLDAALDAEHGDARTVTRLMPFQTARDQHAPDVEVMALDVLARRVANDDDLAAPPTPWCRRLGTSLAPPTGSTPTARLVRAQSEASSW